MPALTVAVIIPVYNGGAKFRASLNSVQKANPAPDEIIVVGDGDTDGSSGFAESAGVSVYRFSDTGGPARARNLGGSKAHSELLFFVDADVTIPQDAIDRVRKIFIQDPALAAAIGSYDDQPMEKNFLSQYRNLMHHFVHQHGCEEASTFWGACGAIRREIFLAAGGFDERYIQPSIEDIELGYRLKQAGYSIKLVKSLQVKHLKCWTVASMVRADFCQRALPWTDLIYRDRKIQNDLNISVSGRASVLLTFSMLGALSLSLWQPLVLIGVAFMWILLLLINRRFYLFLRRKRGVLFALGAIPWHWFYFVYSGAAFAMGTLRHFANQVCSTDRQVASFVMDPSNRKPTSGKQP